MKLFSKHRSMQRQRGLTLLEIMVASALLILIIFGLMLMFNQTQRAFRSGLKQVDVLEAGRAALQMIAMDVEQMDASQRSDATNVWIGMQTAMVPSTFLAPSTADWSGNTTPPPALQTNYIQSLFFLRDNNDWEGVGYRVLNMPLSTNLMNRTDNVMVGTLYRFFMANAPVNSGELQTNHYLQKFTNGAPYFYLTNNNTAEGTFRRVIDGVVHFYARTYDSQGKLVTNAPPNVVVEPDLLSFAGLPNWGPPRTVFTGSALPGYIELELGILEPQALEQAKPLISSGNTAAIGQFLSNHCGKIHIFRQKIPIRTVSR